MQHRLIELSPRHAGLALSLHGSAIYFGIGLFGVVGGEALTIVGARTLPEVAALLCAAAGVVLVVFWGTRRARRGEAREEAVVG
ncbi:hypothetical protein ACWEOE_07910 [Amycolatopsis sp. NPDC004368]